VSRKLEVVSDHGRNNVVELRRKKMQEMMTVVSDAGKQFNSTRKIIISSIIA